MRPELALVLAALFTAPLAAAGTEDAPELQDQNGDARYQEQARDDLDIQRAWLFHEGGALHLNVRLREVAQFQQNALYVFFFTTPGGRHFASLGIGGAGEQVWRWGAYTGNQGETCPQDTDPYTMSSRGTSVGEAQPGNPAYVRWTVPFGDVAVGRGDPVRDVFVFAFVVEGACKVAADFTGKAEYAIPAKRDILERLVPGFEAVGLAVAVLLAALAAARRRG